MSRSVALLIGYGQTATARRIIVSSQDVVRLTQESLGHSFFNSLLELCHFRQLKSVPPSTY